MTSRIGILGKRSRCAATPTSDRDTKSETMVRSRICSTSHPVHVGFSEGTTVIGAGCSGAGSGPGSDHGFGGEVTRFRVNAGTFESTRKGRPMQAALSVVQKVQTEFPQGLKPGVSLKFAARLKSCPPNQS